ncbi:DUF6296 family protein (plasmid) [Streptomyces sp. BI20]|uniref:DUF6296 family protein n=1 Tax=Streptomyces sp. BI20 TaxID=3403460 RepID=UPI003C7605A3
MSEHAERPDTWELLFPASADGSAAEETLLVTRTSGTGAGGHPVYEDRSGIVRAEISDRGEVRMLASGGRQSPPHGVRARRPSA